MEAEVVALAGCEELSHAVALRVGEVGADGQPAALPRTISEGEPLRPPLRVAVRSGEVEGAHVGEKLPVTEGETRGEGVRLPCGEALSEGEPLGEADALPGSESVPDAEWRLDAQRAASLRWRWGSAWAAGGSRVNPAARRLL